MSDPNKNFHWPNLGLFALRLCFFRHVFAVTSLLPWGAVHNTHRWIMGVWRLSAGLSRQRHALWRWEWGNNHILMCWLKVGSDNLSWGQAHTHQVSATGNNNLFLIDPNQWQWQFSGHWCKKVWFILEDKSNIFGSPSSRLHDYKRPRTYCMIGHLNLKSITQVAVICWSDINILSSDPGKT